MIIPLSEMLGMPKKAVLKYMDSRSLVAKGPTTDWVDLLILPPIQITSMLVKSLNFMAVRTEVVVMISCSLGGRNSTIADISGMDVFDGFFCNGFFCLDM